ncbi:MAG: hypothetical protein RJA63_2296 [Pseudomonadota bacterium]|jgi:hypothetical protein
MTARIINVTFRRPVGVACSAADSYAAWVRYCAGGYLAWLALWGIE